MTDLRLAGEVVGSMDRLADLLKSGVVSMVEHEQKKDSDVFVVRLPAIDRDGEEMDEQTIVRVPVGAAPHLIELVNRLVAGGSVVAVRSVAVDEKKNGSVGVAASVSSGSSRPVVAPGSPVVASRSSGSPSGDGVTAKASS